MAWATNWVRLQLWLCTVIVLCAVTYCLRAARAHAGCAQRWPLSPSVCPDHVHLSNPTAGFTFALGSSQQPSAASAVSLPEQVYQAGLIQERVVSWMGRTAELAAPVAPLSCTHLEESAANVHPSWDTQEGKMLLHAC